MPLPTLLGLGAAAVLVLAVALWLVSLLLRDSSIMDVAWGPLFVVVAGLGFVLGDGWPVRRGLLLALTALWGLRLALHIGRRNAGAGEDPRYAAWREEHGEAWPLRSLAHVFLLQGAILWVVALPLPVAQSAPAPAGFTALDVLGTAVWGAGFAVEAVADAQLRRHRQAGADGLLTTGLWRWSRHPNYFGEVVLWWGVWLVACSVPWGWATVGSPLLVTVLVRWVSGVPMTERRMEGRPGWEAYRRRTSPFVPLPPSNRDPDPTTP